MMMLLITYGGMSDLQSLHHLLSSIIEENEEEEEIEVVVMSCVMLMNKTSYVYNSCASPSIHLCIPPSIYPSIDQFILSILHYYQLIYPFIHIPPHKIESINTSDEQPTKQKHISSSSSSLSSSTSSLSSSSSSCQ